ncbi:hypothetical protein V3C99_018338 [Haemonchus contortus]
MSSYRLRPRMKSSVGETSNASPNVSENCPADLEIANMSMSELVSAMMERNEQIKDHVMAKFLNALVSELPQTIADAVEADKRGRSLVVSRIPESSPDVPPSGKQRELEVEVSEILDILRVECRPVEVYCMGKPEISRPSLVKLVLPSRNHWITALTNSHRLRAYSLSTVFVRKSLTPAECTLEKQLRLECRKRNDQLNSRVWVVYRGELRRAD